MNAITQIRHFPNKCSLIQLPIVAISGESNAQGFAENSLLPSSLLGYQNSVKILNNTSLSSFDELEISTIGDGIDNTHVGGFGSQTWGASHGWEAGLSQMAKDEKIRKPIYLVKTPQGGSIIEQWKPGSIYSTDYDYQTMFNNRVDAALTLRGVTSISNKFILLYSQGLNNRTFSMPDWIDHTVERFNYLRTRYGMFPIIMTKFGTAYQNVSDAVGEVCNMIENCFFIDTVGFAMRDDLHWNYPSTIQIPNLMLEKAIENGYCF